MIYKLFLDDIRNPVHCIAYMKHRIGGRNHIYFENEWLICRTYESFKNTLEEHGLPEFVSFDHDLSTEHYREMRTKEDWEEYNAWDGREETGLDCAKYLVDYCMKNKLKLPEYAVHSMNPVGAEAIGKYLYTAKSWL